MNPRITPDPLDSSPPTSVAKRDLRDALRQRPVQILCAIAAYCFLGTLLFAGVERLTHRPPAPLRHWATGPVALASPPEATPPPAAVLALAPALVAAVAVAPVVPLVPSRPPVLAPVRPVRRPVLPVRPLLPPVALETPPGPSTARQRAVAELTRANSLSERPMSLAMAAPLQAGAESVLSDPTPALVARASDDIYRYGSRGCASMVPSSGDAAVIAAQVARLHALAGLLRALDTRRTNLVPELRSNHQRVVESLQGCTETSGRGDLPSGQ